MASRRPVSPRRLTTLISTLVFLDLLTWLAAIPLLPVWQKQLNLSDDQAGLVLGAYPAAVLLASIPAGYLADRIGARRLTLIGVGAFVVAAPAIAFADTLTLLIVVRAVQGVCSAVVWSAGIAWLSAALPRSDRARGLSTANAVATVGTIMGPVFGGPIVARVGIGNAFLVLGIIVFGALLWALFEAGGEAGPVAHEQQQGPFAALRAAIHPGALQMSFIAIAFISLTMGALQLLGALHLDGAGLSSANIGWVYTLGSVLSVLAILVVGRLGDRLDRVRTMTFLPIVVAGLLLLLMIPLGVPWYIGVLVIVIGIQAPIFTIAYTACGDGARAAGIGEGGAYGMMNALWAIGAVISPIVAGIFTQGGRAFVVYAAIAVIALFVTVVLQRSRAVLGRGIGSIP